MNLRTWMSCSAVLFIIGGHYSAPTVAADVSEPPAHFHFEMTRPQLPAVVPGADQWQPGLDYAVLIPPVPTYTPPGKVEVLVRHLYTAQLSWDYERYLEKWERTKPEYIELVRKPAIRYPHARLQARVFFTLQQLGREDLHSRFFEWVLDPRRFPVYHEVIHPDEASYLKLNLEFATANGVDGRKFADIYSSRDMEEKVINEEIQSYPAGQSSIVVNGKYGTSLSRLTFPKGRSDPEDFARLFRLVEYLAAAEAKAATAVERP